jgi:hypothetical protein
MFQANPTQQPVIKSWPTRASCCWPTLRPPIAGWVVHVYSMRNTVHSADLFVTTSSCGIFSKITTAGFAVVLPPPVRDHLELRHFLEDHY